MIINKKSNKLKKESNILEFAGDLISLDDGRSWKEIKDEAERLAVREWISQKRPYDKNRSR